MNFTGISPECVGCRVVRRHGRVMLIHPGDKRCTRRR